MAINFRPDPLRPLVDQINNDKLRQSAEKVSLLLKRFSELSVGNIQQKDPSYKDNSWYVGFRDYDLDDPIYLMNFKITPATYVCEFRYPQYLPLEVFAKLPWHSTSWQRAPSNHYDMDEIAAFIRQYLNNILEDYTTGKIKAGGKSSAEVLLYRMLKLIYPNTTIKRNLRMDDMRSDKNRPLELDLYLPELKLAIEVQGVQHFEEVWGCNLQLQANDKLKRKLCADKSIKLVWMNWDTLTRQLFRISEDKRIRHLTQMLASFMEGSSMFLWWKSMEEQLAE